tara:strand:+ start:364 stop:510 length:147 start_codon:yes stop_codon:yes gene_type:complete
MPAKMKSSELLEQQKIQEPKNSDYPFSGVADQSESEMNWVKLHQMFDR